MRRLFLTGLVVLALAVPALAQTERASLTTASGTVACVTVSNSSCAILRVNNNTGTVAVSIQNTFSATAAFEATVDGANWTATGGVPVGGGAIVTSATATGIWLISAPGATGVRVRLSAFTSGQADVMLQSASASVGGGGASSTVSVSGNVANTIADGADVTLGAKADAKSTATDTTAVTMMQVLKQLSASIQALAGGTATASVTDPCDGAAKSYVPISITTATTTQLVAASSSNYVYICSINIGPIEVADNIALVEDDTSSCASPTAGIIGGVSAATGWQFAANGGIVLGSGNAMVLKTAATNRYVCLITSTAAEVPGGMTYILAP